MEKILYEFSPERSTERQLEVIPEMIKVVEKQDAPSGIVIYAKYHTEWIQNDGLGQRVLIKHFLDNQK